MIILISFRYLSKLYLIIAIILIYWTSNLLREAWKFTIYGRRKCRPLYDIGLMMVSRLLALRYRRTWNRAAIYNVDTYHRSMYMWACEKNSEECK